LQPRFRKLGSGLGAVALIAGFAGSAIGLVALANPAAADPPGSYTCTVTDTNTGQVIGPVTLTSATAGTPAGTLTGATPGDTVNFNCTGFAAHESVAVIQASGLAAFDSVTPEESYADLSHGNLAGSSDGSGNYNQNLNTLYSSSDSNVTAPPSQVAVDLGAGANIVTAADEGTENPLILIEISYDGAPAPINPVIAPSQYIVNPTGTTPIDINTTSGYWWGAGELGTGAGNSSPIPDPTVLVDGTPIALAGTPGTGSSGATISKASYLFGAPGTPTYAVLSDGGPGGTVLPAGLSAGVHHLTVVEGTQAGGTITSDTTFFVPGGAATGGSCGSGNTGPNTNITCGPTSGWAPTASTFTGEWIAPVGCTEGNQTANLTGVVPGSATQTFIVNTSDLSGATFADPACIPGTWTIDVTQTVGGNTVATASLGPISLVDLTATCSIASTGTCLVQQGLGQQVIGTNLTVTEYAATSGIGAPGQNPSAILVNLGAVTLGPGVFQAGQGMLNTVEVNDSRGTLSGWTVTGILESDFIGPAVGNDNTIPADYLTWNPSVSLTFPGNLNSGVVPYGTVSPPVYGPDACVAGQPDGGTNSNILCPTLTGPSADNATGANPAGSTNNTTSPENHANDPAWPVTNAEGPSGLLNEIQAGPIANLGTSDTGAADFGVQPAQVLCEAASGGGGGAFNCDASLSLAVPPYVAAGHYTATMDLLTTAT
jgi:hypothetical protein